MRASQSRTWRRYHARFGSSARVSPFAIDYHRDVVERLKQQPP